ncbi:MAG: BamA/TamA family outer membrane protein, partial [Candidatus Zixiibacteriota bacterium]
MTHLTTKANYHSGGDFDRLPIPFRAVSTDVVTGAEVIHENGSLSEAMRATMAFPLAFTGLEKNGQLLMDGGMVIPVPVELVRRMSDSIRFVVAVNTASPLLPREELNTPVDIANQVTSIMTADKLREQLESADVVVTPPLEGFGAMDFKRKDSLIAIGYADGLQAADSIIAVLSEERAHRRYTILEIEIVGVSSDEKEMILGKMQGKWLNQSALIRKLKSLAGELKLFRLEAELTPLGVTPDGVKMIRLRLNAQAAPMVADVTFRFTGSSVFDDSTLAAQFTGSDGVLTGQKLRDGLRRITNLYHEKGYDLVVVREADIDCSKRAVRIHIDEAVVQGVDVLDNQCTKDWFVRTRFPLKSGEPYSTARAARGIADIYATDLFDRVVVDFVPHRGGGKVRISVEEKQSRQARLGWHWDEEYDSEEFVELLDDNVGGIGVQFLLHALYGADRHDYQAAVKADRIFKTYLTGTVRLFHHRLERHLFDPDGSHEADRRELKTGGEVRIGQQIARLGTVSGALVVENVEYRHPEGLSQDFGLTRLKLESLVETFDRVPFPETGKKYLFELQFAGEFLGGEATYTRFFTSLEAYFPLGKKLNYHPQLALGLSRSDLPVSEKFFLGGLHRFAGFRTHQLEGDKMFLL